MKQQRIYIDTSIVGGFCVKMKNDIQARIYRKIKKMSGKEILDFFNSPQNRVTFGV